MKLKNPCSYSFEALYKAARENIDSTRLNKMSQVQRNEEVKRLCEIADWYYEDVVGNDGITYTAFSPEIEN